jgi:2-polyprenyl-6-methoxyphenol hydroxylase-like FAD-dependent oxidoreductase
MANERYDVIVVGARCAGSPVAMLLARNGYKVLVVDRATFPSDTISTHLVHPPGVAALRRWGLLDRLRAAGCPPIHTYAFDMGPFVISGSPGSMQEPVAYAPRRTVLDKLLLDAASEAGAEIREGFTVAAVAHEDGRVVGIRGHARDGRVVTERARVVVGADGVHSVVARDVVAEEYRAKPPLQAGYYTYWSGLPMNGVFEAYDRGDRSWAAWPTNDDLTLVIVGWPIAQFDSNKTDIERHYLAALERAPAFRDRVAAARREERFVGMAVPNFFRKPFGPGWALVGDAGYNKDFITAQGIQDAFRDAELCAHAIQESFEGARSFEDAMASYQSTRDERVLAIYEFTCEFASYTPPSPERLQLMAAIHGNQEAMDGFVRIIAGLTSPAEFFSRENVGRILADAARFASSPRQQA